jgi:hypothetical protein
MSNYLLINEGQKKNSPNFLRVLQKNLHSIENKKGTIKKLLIYESAKFQICDIVLDQSQYKTS